MADLRLRIERLEARRQLRPGTLARVTEGKRRELDALVQAWLAGDLDDVGFHAGVAGLHPEIAGQLAAGETFASVFHEVRDGY